jgi:GNAT superfamily N-acetyltransferase
VQVIVAQPEDFPAWLRLAAEVESLFGAPMADSPDFHRALHKNIGRGTAFCVREGDGPPGAPLLGGLLFSPKPPLYTIGWLAVAEQSCRCGVGRRLVEHALGLVQPPAEVVVTTFGAGVEGGQAARWFYESMGFRPAEPAPDGPGGQPRRVYRLRC